MEDEAPEFHSVVKLLLARMESHPEEFEPQNHKWSSVYQSSVEFWTAEEKRAYKAKLRAIKMDAAHQNMMKKLVAGDEADTYYDDLELKLVQQRQLVLKQQQQNVLLASGHGNKSNNTLHVDGDIMMGTQRLNEGILGQIKGALNIR